MIVSSSWEPNVWETLWAKLLVTFWEDGLTDGQEVVAIQYISNPVMLFEVGVMFNMRI